jgi:putative hydrolase of the HAD superfamily
MAMEFIYFDVGNVLLAFSHERMCRQMADVAGVPPEVVWRALFDGELAAQLLCDFETGRVTPDEFFAEFCRTTGTTPDRDRLRLAATDIFAPIESVWHLARQLADDGHRLGLLSNSNVAHWQFITDGRFPLLTYAGGAGSLFSVVVASQQVGAMKPDRLIYDVAIERAGIAAGEICFIDDRPENVDAACQMGIDAVQFTGIEALLAELAKRDVRGIGG